MPKPTSDWKIDRRKFVKILPIAAAASLNLKRIVAGAGAVTSVYGAYEIGRKSIEWLKVSRHIIDELEYKDVPLARKNWGLISSVFGPFDHVIACPAADNPKLKGEIHARDWKASKPFVNALYDFLGEKRLLHDADDAEIKADFPNWDKVFFGGAMSHRFARIAQGYEGSGYHLNMVGRFPQRWWTVYDVDRLNKKEEVLTYGGGGKLRTEPQWGVFDSNKHRTRYPETYTDRSGNLVLKNDFLLVTKVFEQREYKPLVLIGGTHGVGTEAAGYIWVHKPILKELRSAIGDWEQFQALYRITKIEYDHDRKVSRPVEIVLEDVCKLTNDPILVPWNQRAVSPLRRIA